LYQTITSLQVYIVQNSLKNLHIPIAILQKKTKSSTNKGFCCVLAI
jgi:hypothetical protein